MYTPRPLQLDHGKIICFINHTQFAIAIRIHSMSHPTVSLMDTSIGMQVSAKDDINISGIFTQLLTQARLQLLTMAADDDEGVDDGQPLQLRRRQKQKLTKRTSCHVS